MIMLRPFTVGQDELVSSNVAIDEQSWTSGTYSQGTRRRVGNTIYEVVSNSTSDSPADGVVKSPKTWIEVGPINRFKMFKAQISDPTVNPGSIVAEVDVDGTVNGIAFFGLSGNNIKVEMIEPDGTVVYEKDLTLQDFSEITDSYAYFFEDFRFRTQLVAFDIPAYRSAKVRITLTSDTDAKIGFVSLGKQREIGEAVFGLETGISDFSRKEQNIFGHFDVIERGYSRNINFPVVIPTPKIDGVLEVLTEHRAVPAVYVGDKNKTSTMTVGYWRDVQITLSNPSTSELDLEIEGLI